MHAQEASKLQVDQIIYWKIPNSDIWIPAKVVKAYDRGWITIRFENNYLFHDLKIVKGQEMRVGTVCLSSRIKTVHSTKRLLAPVKDS